MRFYGTVMMARLTRFSALLLLALAFGLSGAVANALPEKNPTAAESDHVHGAADGKMESGDRAYPRAMDSEDDGHSHDQPGGCKTTAGHCTSFQMGQDSWSAVPDFNLLLVLAPFDEHLAIGGFLEVEIPPPRS